MTHSAGRVRFSPDGNEPHYVGTVATFNCEDGYVLLPVGEGGSTRRCEIGGWNGTNPTCSKLLVSSCDLHSLHGHSWPTSEIQ